MNPAFTTWVYVSAKPADVYEAIAEPAILSRYFTTGGAEGRLETGQTVLWEFHDFPGAFPVLVLEAAPPSRIVIEWPRPGGTESTHVSFTFDAVDDGQRTKISIHESGWGDDATGRAASYNNCMGWSQMLMALKAWVEHGINLRDGAYR